MQIFSGNIKGTSIGFTSLHHINIRMKLPFNAYPLYYKSVRCNDDIFETWIIIIENYE